MSPIEKTSLTHAKQWLAYAKSKQSLIDLEADKAKREQADKALGHSPRCGILKCHHTCPKMS